MPDGPCAMYRNAAAPWQQKRVFRRCGITGGAARSPPRAAGQTVKRLSFFKSAAKLCFMHPAPANRKAGQRTFWGVFRFCAAPLPVVHAFAPFAFRSFYPFFLRGMSACLAVSFFRLCAPFPPSYSTSQRPDGTVPFFGCAHFLHFHSRESHLSRPVFLSPQCSHGVCMSS